MYINRNLGYVPNRVSDIQNEVRMLESHNKTSMSGRKNVLFNFIT